MRYIPLCPECHRRVTTCEEDPYCDVLKCVCGWDDTNGQPLYVAQIPDKGEPC